jgi:hypothetical protein
LHAQQGKKWSVAKKVCAVGLLWQWPQFFDVKSQRTLKFEHKPRECELPETIFFSAMRFAKSGAVISGAAPAGL